MKSSIFQNSTKKNLIDFCPGRFYRLGTCDLFWLFSRRLYWGECITYLAWINRAEIYQIFLVVFWKIDDFINTFWLHLSFTPLLILYHKSKDVHHMHRGNCLICHSRKYTVARNVDWLVKVYSFFRQIAYCVSATVAHSGGSKWR